MLKESLPVVALSALENYNVVGRDGPIGTTRDFLFLDDRWQVRWLVIDTGAWLSGRKVLIHPSAIADIDHEREEILTPLTTEQIEASPHVGSDEKLSEDLESRLFSYYGWDRDWGRSLFGKPSDTPPALPGAITESVDDPHLRSFETFKGYRLRATDGEIGRIRNFLIDNDGWNIRYLIVATGSWLFGKEVLLAPYAVTAVDWLNQEVLLNVTREQVKDSPPWDPLKLIDEMYEQRLHRHYGWPRYT
jgi:hypothetical protein